MPHLSSNILLGKPWIHEIHVVPSMLHHMLKYIYNNKVYTIKFDTKLKICLQTDKGMGSPLKTLEPTSKVEPLQEEVKDECLSLLSKLLEDNWGSLNFTPTFKGEYKITTTTSYKGKEIAKISIQSIVDSSKAFESTTSSKEDTTYTSTYDKIDHEKPPSLREMEALYGKGYQLLKQFSYNGK